MLGTDSQSLSPSEQLEWVGQGQIPDKTSRLQVGLSWRPGRWGVLRWA